MIDVALVLNPRPVVGRLRRVGRDGRRWYSQELNRQLRASKGSTGRSKVLPVVGMSRRIRDASHITPLKRIARRIRFPRTAFANAKKLVAGGLCWFDAFPMRYFPKGLPGGARRVENTVDKHGRRYVGGAFVATMRNGRPFNMKRLAPKGKFVGGRPAQNPNTNWLPIGHAEYADITPIAYPVRMRVLRDLARHWPRQLSLRWQKEFRRIFGA